MINIGKWGLVNDMIQPMSPVAMIEEFDSEEIQRIEDIAQSHVTKRWVDESASFNGTFIPYGDETAWLYGRIRKLFDHVNYAYDLKNLDMIEHIWVVEYTEGDFENYHADLNAGIPYCSRALSMIVNLNDSDDYRGGEINFLNGSDEYVIKRSKGTATIHPSYLYKRLDKVTSGKKRILLAWISNNSNNI